MSRNDPISVLLAGPDTPENRDLGDELQKAGFLVRFRPFAGVLTDPSVPAECDVLLLVSSGTGGAEATPAACRRLCEDAGECRVPVVVLAATGGPRFAVRAFEAGAADCVRPDVDGDELATRLRAHANRHRECEALRAATIRDRLTGLFNRSYFEDRLREELSRIERYGGDLGVLLIDLDEFKQINDRFGHAAGDAALRRTAEIIRDTVRKTDLAARFGGDEFAVSLLGVETAHPLVVAERLREAIESGTKTPPAEFPPFTASLGATAVAGRIADPAALLAEADSALYASKRLGRNRATRFHVHGEDANDA